MDVRQIVKNNLILMGFDGLCSDECGCQVSDLMPCDYEGIARCEPGYKHPAAEDDPEGHDFYIKPEKPEGHEKSDISQTCGKFATFACDVQKRHIEIAIEAVDNEPEFPGEMPDELYSLLKVCFDAADKEDDREPLTEAMRLIARQTKRGIRERIILTNNMLDSIERWRK